MLSSILLVLIFISVLITFHEFGHLIVAKMSHIPVEVFSVGFGPAILKKKIGETEYRLSVVPLGGYIKMVGEEDQATGGFNERSFGVKAAVIAAGPVFNLFLGFLMLVTMYLMFGVKYVSPVLDPLPGSQAAALGLEPGDLLIAAQGETIPTFGTFDRIAETNAGKEIHLTVIREGRHLDFLYQVPTDTFDIQPLICPVLGRVRKGSPAASIGLRAGDTIVSVADSLVQRWDEFVGIVIDNGGSKIPISWHRQGELHTDSVIPALETDQLTGEKIGQIGVWVSLPKKSLPVHIAVWEGLNRTGYVVVQTFVILYKVVTRQITARAIGGPIMVAKIAYEGASWGAEYFLALWALLSINLFVVNMLPIPVLDGGRIVLFVVETVRRRKLTEKEMTWAANIGWIMIGAILIFTVFNDVIRIIKK